MNTELTTRVSPATAVRQVVARYIDLCQSAEKQLREFTADDSDALATVLPSHAIAGRPHFYPNQLANSLLQLAAIAQTFSDQCAAIVCRKRSEWMEDHGNTLLLPDRAKDKFRQANSVIRKYRGTDAAKGQLEHGKYDLYDIHHEYNAWQGVCARALPLLELLPALQQAVRSCDPDKFPEKDRNALGEIAREIDEFVSKECAKLEDQDDQDERSLFELKGYQFSSLNALMFHIEHERGGLPTAAIEGGDTTSQVLLEYAEQCERHSDVVGTERGQDSDPQVTVLRTQLLGLPKNAIVLEIGAGKGRLLRAFNSLDAARARSIRYVAVDQSPRYFDDVNETARMLNVTLASVATVLCHEAWPEADLIVVANVLHEVAAPEVPEFMSRILRGTKPGGHVLILEALELAVGEKDFVVYDAAGIEALFARLKNAGRLVINSATPQSHGGTPLLETLIQVDAPESAKLDKDDVISALTVVIDGDATAMRQHRDGIRKLNARQRAFRAHNSANAQVYLNDLRTA